ncbi:uncharacterized protein [Linepithema humile]|uniref:uncharacterized protein n=1 Tax=Linepithema humile TaxID=83485 RepID=UPI0006232CC2|nr:PREDICTED: uncharacterized protein LOC105675510 isoform X2 [Linepithema humile]
MSQVDITKDNVWYHYERILEQFFRAKCKICESTNKRLKGKPEIYYDNVHLRCRVCLEHLPSQKYNTHWHSADEIARYETSTNKIEFFTQNSDFTVKCKVVTCSETITFSLSATMYNHVKSKTHLKKLRSIQTDAMSMPPTIANKSEQLQNYIILSNFQAKCKSCDFQVCYIDTTNFSLHVRERHVEVTSYEEKNGREYPWIYFKYHAKYTSQCLYCPDVFSPSQLQYLKLHLDYCHPPDTLAYYQNDYDWVWKYCKKSGDFEVQCSFCFTEISLDVNSHFNHHTHHFKDTHWQKLTSTRRTYDTAELSGSQQNCKKD